MTTPFTTDMTATDLELVVTDVLAVLELPIVETSGTEEFSAWLTIHGPADIALTVSADHAGALQSHSIGVIDADTRSSRAPRQGHAIQNDQARRLANDDGGVDPRTVADAKAP